MGGKSISIRTLNDYAQLKRSLQEKGFFRRQPAYYLRQAAIIVTLYSIGIGALLFLPGYPLKLLSAFILAFTFTQLGYVGHDAGHRQIFPTPRGNDVVLLIGGLLAGVSPSWWVVNHNKHHSSPNDPNRDPHIMIPLLAFSEAEAEAKTGVMRSILRFQGYYFFPLLVFEGLGIRLASATFLLQHPKAKYRALEGAALLGHFALYAWLVLSVLTPLEALGFFLLQQSLTGLYLGSVFAPNHKGMPLVPRELDVDFIRRQLVTTRNVRPHPVTDFLCGGLNYQIEHHLFPNLPRNRLGKARQYVKAFCEERGMPYYETGWMQSYAEILRYLHRVGRPVKHEEVASMATPRIAERVGD